MAAKKKTTKKKAVKKKSKKKAPSKKKKTAAKKKPVKKAAKKKASAKKKAPAKKKSKKTSKKKGTGAKSSDPSDRSEYHRKYWQENKKRISKRRRERYQNDPEYRARHLEQTRKSRERKRQEEADKRLERDRKMSEKRHKGEELKRPRLMKIKGKPTACYSTSALARYIARSNETIRRWLTMGVLPGVSYVDDSGHYWFTKSYCETLRDCVEEMYHRPRQRKGGRGDTEVLKELVGKVFKKKKVGIKKVR